MPAARLLKTKKLERAICLAAARVITTTVELRDQFAVDYPDLRHKFVTITNGFDIEPGIGSREGHAAVRSGAGRPAALKLSHFGTLYGKRSPLPLLLAVKELHAEDGIGPQQLNVRFVGAWELPDGDSNALARELEAHGLLRRDPRLPHELCQQEMRTASVLLVLQPGSPLQIPAKLYEYAATGRPLLLIGGEGATSSLVERHRLGWHCAAEAAAIKPFLRRLIRGETQIEPPSQADTRSFDYRTLTAALAGVLDSTLDGRPRATDD